MPNPPPSTTKTDTATLAGLVLAVGCLTLAALATPGASWRAFFDAPSLLIVFGGALASATMCFPMRTVRNMPEAVSRVLWNKEVDLRALVERLVKLGTLARREGLLSLERRLDATDHPLVKHGLQLAIDGASSPKLAEILRGEIDERTHLRQEEKQFLEQMGRFAPAFGMIGTLFGLVCMLGSLKNPLAIGSGMAVALMTTLYGAVAANVVFLPFAEKLQRLLDHERLAFEIARQGVLAIQAGEGPHVIETQLQVFLTEPLEAASFVAPQPQSTKRRAA